MQQSPGTAIRGDTELHSHRGVLSTHAQLSPDTFMSCLQNMADTRVPGEGVCNSVMEMRTVREPQHKDPKAAPRRAPLVL